MIPSPTPDGCRWCGIAELRHYTQAARPENGGLHQWTEPTDEQRLARMLARRTAAQRGLGVKLWTGP